LIRLLNAYFPSRTIFLGISEAFLVVLAFVCATVARLGGTDAAVMLNYEQGYFKILVIAVSILTCMYYFDLYDSAIMSNWREVLVRLVQVLGSVCILLAVLYYAYPPLELGRGIFAIGFALVAVILFFWRRLFLAINSQHRFAERVLLFGEGPLASRLRRELEARPEFGLRIVSQVMPTSHDENEVNCEAYENSAARCLTATDEEVSRAVELHRVNRVIVAMGERRGKLPLGLLLTLKSHGVQVQDGTDVYEAVTGKVPIESLRLGWLLFSPGFHVSRFLLFYKRFASMLISVSGLLLSLPLLPFVALTIKLSSRGPVFYKQRRVGRDGDVFDCYKFRTMRADAEADSGPTWAGDDDPRITPVGRFLRLSRLDEIPQLWNVLKGDMSFVGPRPERPEFVDTLNHEIPHYSLRHTIRPGITGWAQIRYKYGASIEDAKEKLRYDLFYIKNMSPGLDSLIFLHTVKTILLGRGAR
jgi:sugar transferase (PEP-CTERM system associated)